MSNMETKVTLTAVDKVSPTLKAIGVSFQKMKLAAQGISASFSGIGSAASDFGARLRNFTLVAGAAGGAMFALAKSQGEYAERITQLSQKTGFSTQSLQKWQYVAGLNNLQLEDMVVGMRKLSMSMAQVTADPKSDIAKWFKKNNLLDAKGQVLSLEETMFRLSDIFKNAPDGQQKMATAMKLLGRAGVNLIPILNEGGDSIREMMAKAEEYGLVISDKVLKQQAKFDDNVDRLKFSLLGLKMAIASELIPYFDPMVQGMKDWINANRPFIAQQVGKTVKEFSEGMKIVSGVLWTVGKALAPVVEAFGGLKTVIAAIALTYIGGLVMSFGRLVMSIAMLVPALFNMGKALYFVGAAGWGALAPMLAIAAPIAGIVAAVGLIGVALYELWQDFDKTKAAWNHLWGQLPEPVKNAFTNALSAITGGMSSIASAVYNNWESIKGVLSQGNLGETFSKMFEGAKEKVASALSDITSAFSNWISQIVSYFSPLTNLLDRVVNGILKIKNALAGGITGSVSVNSSVPAGVSSGGGGGGVQASPSLGGAKTALNTTPQVGALAYNSAPQKQHLDVFMKIDSEGRPKVSARSNQALTFTSSTGKMV